MNEVPRYVKHSVDQLLAVLRYAEPKDLETIRTTLIEAAKLTVDMQLANYAHLKPTFNRALER